MNRIVKLVVTATASIALTSASLGQVITINQPRVVDDEFANATSGITGGDSSTISVNVPAGLDGGGEVIDTENILIDIVVLNSAGASQGSPGGPGLPFDTGVVYVDATGNNVSIDLSLFNFATVTGWPNPAYVIQLTATSATGTGLVAVFNSGDETLDETLALDSTVPTLIDFKVTATMAFATFSERIDSDGVTPGANVNDTDLGAGAGQFDASDFQVNTTSTFAGTELAPTLLTAPAFAGTTVNMVTFSLGGGSTAVGGDFIRLSHDGAPGNSTHDLTDIVGNVGDATAVQIQAVAALDATSAELLSTVAAGATVVDALRVTFNNTIAIVGDAADYTLLLSGTPSTYTLANPKIDPGDPSSVLIDVTAPGGDGITSDAFTTSSLGAASGEFTVRVLNDGGGAEITDDYLQGITVADDVIAADKIESNLLTGGFEDFNTIDGRQDTAILVFDEPMATPAAITGFTLTMQDNVAVNPIDQVALDGTLVAAATAIDTGTPANNEIPIIGVTLASIDFDNDGTVTARETNNALRVSYDPATFDWDHDGSVGPVADADEPVPGTGDPSAISIDYTVASNEITDAAANIYSNSSTDIAQLTATDYAAPIIAVAGIIAGDNTDPNPLADITTNGQVLAELFPGANPVAADIGQAIATRRVVLAFSENMAALTNAILEENVTIGGTALPAAASETGSFGFASANKLTLRNSGADAGFDVGAAVAIATGSGIVDASARAIESTDSATTSDIRAPFLPLQAAIVPGGVPIHNAFTADTNNNGFADEIQITMTQPILVSTLANSDFTLSNGTVTGIALDPTDPTIIVVSIAEGVVGSGAIITVTYKGTTDATLIASDSGVGGTGAAVSALDSTFLALPLNRIPTDNAAIMEIIGTATQGGTPLPVGTQIIAMVATPTVRSITAEHNTNFFTATDTTSITAWTNWLLGIGGAKYVYLGRDATNNQTYSNSKALADPVNEQTLNDVIQLNINARTLTRIIFTGSGENRGTDRLNRGSVQLCWDVIRSSNGTTAALHAGGYVFGGLPVVSRTIIDTTDGSFGLHVGAPISAFNKQVNLNSIGRPVILIAELTNGTRFPLTSLITSVNGAPILFSPSNRTRNLDRTAKDATVFNFDLDNVGAINAYPGWNLLGFNRVSGFAARFGNRPSLPAGLSAADVVIGSKLPFVNALDQFVYFTDTTPDGVWTNVEDANFQNIIIDHDCFSNFAFTMTSFGVQAGRSITNLVGGYGLGFFVSNTTTYGIFQFGAMRTGADYFTTSFPFPTTTTTQGWGLLTAPSASATTPLKTANAEFDFLIQFRNTGMGFEVMSIDLDAPTGPDNINDATDVNQGEASFYHTK